MSAGKSPQKPILPQPTPLPLQGLNPIIATQLLNYGAGGLSFPLVTLYLTDVGLNGTEIGSAIALASLFCLTLGPVATYWADRTHRHRLLFRVLVALMAAGTLAMIVYPQKLWITAAFLLYYVTFWLQINLHTQLTVTWLAQQGRDIYGQVRAWGSFGWAVTSSLSGWLFNLGGYALLYVLSALTALVVLPLSGILPHHTNGQPESPCSAQTQAATAAPGRDLGFYVLLIGLFFFALGNQGVNTFSVIYWSQTLGADKTWIGLLIAIKALAEMPGMVLLNWAVRRWGVTAVVIAGMVISALVWFTYTLITSTGPLLPLMLILGWGYAFSTTGSVLLINEISPPQRVATDLILSQVTVVSIATLLGGPLSGRIFDSAGGATLFQVDIVLAALGAAALYWGKQQ